MIYPIRTAYQDAMHNASLSLLPEALRGGSVKRYDKGMSAGQPWLWSGGFSAVFRVEAGGKTWALRCFTADIGEAARIYAAIGKHLDAVRSRHFVGFEFHEAGIRVQGKTYPLVQMEWVSGPLLKDFICACLNEPDALRRLARAWQRLLAHLAKHQIAHGDLQHGNIVIVGDRADPLIKLIDYDTVVVPDIVGLPENNGGLPSFQHPRRRALVHTKDLRIDAFSGVAIYASLIALAARPGLWNELDVAKREGLLFTGRDFESPRDSTTLEALEGLGDECRSLAGALRHASELPPLEVPPLERLLAPRDGGQKARPWWVGAKPMKLTTTEEPPKVVVDTWKEPPRDLEPLRALARQQRSVLVAILAELVAIVLCSAGGQAFLPLWLLVAGLAAVAAFRLTSALRGNALAGVLSVLVLVPVAGVLALLSVSVLARDRLRAEGVVGGLLGPKPEDVTND